MISSSYRHRRDHALDVSLPVSAISSPRLKSASSPLIGSPAGNLL
jgi:hypothetical protein